MSEQSIPQIIELADGTKCVRLEDFLRERDEAMEESLEQARLLGISGERECRIIAELNEFRKEIVGWENKLKAAQENDHLKREHDRLAELAEELEDVYEERDQLRYTLCNFLGISVMESHDAIITQAKEATK